MRIFRLLPGVAMLSRSDKLQRWFLMQCSKRKPNLRASYKKEVGGLVKAPPRIVFFEETQDREINDFMGFNQVPDYILDNPSF